MAGGRGEDWSGMGTAWSVIGTLFAGILVWGGIGLLLDRWLDLRWLFLPIGMVVGISASIYMVYLRYGRDG
jgi:F0F1-type ATP synthase assembly protein I